MTVAFCGLGIATLQAVVVGPAHLIERDPHAVSPRLITIDDVPGELARLAEALTAAREALAAIREQIPRASSMNVAELLDAHLLMLEDATLVEPTRELIRGRLFGAEWALHQHRTSLVEVFEAVDDPYLRSRRDDVDQVVNHVLGFLVGAKGVEEAQVIGLKGQVVVARDLSPADTVMLHHQGVAALVTEYGGPTSHTAILARSLNMPAVIGVRGITLYLRHGETLIVDGEKGIVLADADPHVLDHYRRRLGALAARRSRLQRLVSTPARSADGVRVKLLANLELPEDIATARANGADGVGLYRTEFLYMNREDLPDEEEHFATYLEVVRGLKGIPVTIRTLDLGADKQVDGAMSGGYPPVCNPALGLRAIRLCLKEPELFRPQLRAILRASAHGPVALMIPMLSGIRELDSVLALIEETRQGLTADGLAFDPRMRVGGMIEVPAAALCARAFARRLDFLSLGTNDLIQYTLAIDRVDDSVSYLYDPLHPAILRLIRGTIEAGERYGKPVAMCGEMAGDLRYTRLLLGLGLKQLSMQPGSLLEVKEMVRRCDVAKLAREMEGILARLDEVEPDALGEAIEALGGGPM